VLAYAIRRILWTVPQLILVFTIVFFVMRVAGGDPTHVILGELANAEALRNMRESLGLNRPIAVQYGVSLLSLLQGDFGRSMINNQPIAPQVFEVLPYTLELTAAAIVIGILTGLPFGIVSAVRKNTMVDYLLRVFSLVGLSMPAFYLGVLLLIGFAVKLDYFPIIGFKEGGGLLQRLHFLFLPALSLGLTMAAFTSRMSRSSMLERLGADYVRTARAKGLPESKVIFKHALKDSLIPIITVIGVYVGVLMGGSILTEMVFSRPGLGKFLIGAIQQRDYNAIQSGLVIYAGIVVLVNLAVDLAYGMVDPRVKYD
jgi:ABC-type dipeptide/oligopeptide/nickel transport system permease component